MSNIFYKFNMRRLMASGMTEVEAKIECDRRHKIAMEVPCDLGPDWIDTTDTIHEHFRKLSEGGGNH
jgi:hypothetical protein